MNAGRCGRPEMRPFALSSNTVMSADRLTIVAVSGGADSVALLWTLLQEGRQCIAAHCNFGLRGEESDRDQAFVEELCLRLQVPLRVKRFDAREEAKAAGESIEMACRRLRYGWFEELRAEVGAQTIAVGHNRDDQIETFFLNLIRGSGTHGLRGMRRLRGAIERPLLGMWRSDIEALLEREGLSHIEDSSNAEDSYTRNRIRHFVLPALRQVSPGALDGVLRSMQILAEEDDRLEGSGDLWRTIRAKGFNPSVSTDIEQAIKRNVSGRIFTDTSGSKWIVNRGELLPLREDEENTFSGFLSDLPLEVTRIPSKDFRPNRDAWTLWVDASVADMPGVWELRPWRHGDRIKPFGMGGHSRLVSDIVSDAHLSLNDKKQLRVLTFNGEVLWVPGLRTSIHHPVAGDALQIRLKSLKP